MIFDTIPISTPFQKIICSDCEEELEAHDIETQKDIEEEVVMCSKCCYINFKI